MSGEPIYGDWISKEQTSGEQMSGERMSVFNVRGTNVRGTNVIGERMSGEQAFREHEKFFHLGIICPGTNVRGTNVAGEQMGRTPKIHKCLLSNLILTDFKGDLEWIIVWDLSDRVKAYVKKIVIWGNRGRCFYDQRKILQEGFDELMDISFETSFLLSFDIFCNENKAKAGLHFYLYKHRSQFF